MKVDLVFLDRTIGEWFQNALGVAGIGVTAFAIGCIISFTFH